MKVEKIIFKNNKIEKVILNDKKEIKCDLVVVVIGGLSYLFIGFIGDGYKFVIL